ncbi:DUF3341 domain-containing protein [Candidatus Sumerlaeota bacterium]|nr:DUF3341 domain-containing protein [Candidatus Sumerlaeota bacterium]
MSETISAVFAHQDTAIRVIEDLRARGHRGIDVMIPVPDHHILDILPKPETKVGWIFSLWGGIFGVTLGFLFPAWAHSFVYQQITGGKPVITWPPFVVPGFEMLVLFTGLATFTGVIVLCRLPQRHGDPHFDERATEDHYVVEVTTEEDRVDEVRALLREAGGEVR